MSFDDEAVKFLRGCEIVSLVLVVLLIVAMAMASFWLCGEQPELYTEPGPVLRAWQPSQPEQVINWDGTPYVGVER